VLDDNEVVRRAIADLLTAVPGFEIVGEAAQTQLSRRRARIPAVGTGRRDLDARLLDGRLLDGSGIDVCRDVRSQLPDTHCVILISYDDEDAALASCEIYAPVRLDWTRDAAYRMLIYGLNTLSAA